MNFTKAALVQFLRSPVNPRPVHRLKLNTVFRLTLILLLGGAGLTACANLPKEQTAHKQENDVTVLSAEQLKTLAEQGHALGQNNRGGTYRGGKVSEGYIPGLEGAQKCVDDVMAKIDEKELKEAVASIENIFFELSRSDRISLAKRLLERRGETPESCDQLAIELAIGERYIPSGLSGWWENLLYDFEGAVGVWENLLHDFEKEVKCIWDVVLAAGTEEHNELNELSEHWELSGSDKASLAKFAQLDRGEVHENCVYSSS